MQDYVRTDKTPIPPKGAKMVTTGCDYCIVGCGYKAYVWPEGKEGGLKKDQNAFGIDFPAPALSGRNVSPNQHNYCMVDGKRHHVVVVADGDATVVNRQGNHSIRGGCIAKKTYDPKGPTKDRLAYPMLRINGTLKRISWDDAIDIMAKVSRHVLDKHGEPAWGMKTYSYQYFENTYAISKLAFEAIQTPAYAPHDKPGPGNDTAGIDDAGIIPFSACNEEWANAEVILISGTDPFESKTIVFTEWMMKGEKKKIIMVNPRKTAGAAWAEKNGGLFLSIIPGTDAILHMALVRLILENGWEDKDFIKKWIASRWEIDSGFGRGTRNTPWQWRTTWGKLGADFGQYRKWLLAYPLAELDKASEITGIPAAKIRQCAEMIAKPVKGERPKTSFAFEKGNYWSNNYLNTASYSSLGLICGAGNRPGRVISRLGGHQRGWYGAAGYPRIASPEKFPGRRKKEIDLDRWVENGKLRFAWVIGTTWCQAMAASHELENSFRKQTRENPNQIRSVGGAAETLIKRVDSGGMVVVFEDIYMQEKMGSEFADLVLPAATWGEEDFSRCNGERRLKLYSKFCDAPGEAKPDWKIIQMFAQKMGFKDFDWKDANDLFEKAARSGRGKLLNYHPLVWYAKKLGMKGHQLLRSLGTHGIQTPIRWYRNKPNHSDDYLDYAGFHNSEHGWLVGTRRIHDSELDPGVPEGPTVIKKWLTHFHSHSGKGLLHKTPWELFGDFFERVRPKGDELWVTTGRINEIWQSAFDDKRRPFIMQRWPENWIEIHPDDAKKRGIESGDYVQVVNDDVVIQTGGFVGVKGNDLSYTALEKAGRIRVGKGSIKAVAIVTDAVRPGVTWTNFLDTGSAANSLVPRVPDPMTNRYRFKLGKGKFTRLGESPYKTDFTKMTFAPRTVV